MHHFGWKKQPHDHRDWKLKHLGVADPIPADLNVDLRDKFKDCPAWDQLDSEACTAHGSLACYWFEKGGGPYSRLEVWYKTRELEGSQHQNAGCYNRDAVKILANVGAGLEADWPFDPSLYYTAPPQKELDEAAQDKIVNYYALETPDDYKRCLMQGYPFLIGINVWESIENQETVITGIVQMPQENEQLLGGHCICICGYTKIEGAPYYIMRNSWGSTWGINGYAYIPEAYIDNPDWASDAWTIRS